MQNARHFALCSFMLVLLIAALPSLAVGRVVGVDALSLDPAMVQPAPAAPVFAVPGTPIVFTNPGGHLIVIVEAAYSPNADLISANSLPQVTTAFPGDIIMLANPTGGDAPSNWAAVLRFLNPGDPTGSLNLDATEDEAFLARDMGPNGFANFSLFPNTMYATSTPSTSPAGYIATFTEFGEAGGISPGQTAVLTFVASDSSIPEPGTVALLALGIGTGVLVALRRRTRRV